MYLLCSSSDIRFGEDTTPLAATKDDIAVLKRWLDNFLETPPSWREPTLEERLEGFSAIALDACDSNDYFIQVVKLLL